jgi:hypothetical protein
MSNVERWDVFSVVERGEGRDSKSFWMRAGVAFTNKDGSINVKLDLLPVNGTLQLRIPDPKEEPRENDRERARDDRDTRGPRR